MRNSNRSAAAWLALASIAGVVSIEACSSDDDTSTVAASSTASSSVTSSTTTSSTTSTASGGGGASGSTTSSSTTSTTTSTTASTGGAASSSGTATGGGGAGGSAPVKPSEIVYTESNDPAGNMIYAFAHNADGTISPVAGSPFSAGGDGLTNTMQVLGPEDSDQAVIVDQANKRLFATNGGSNTVAVFDIGADGALTAVTGSPFSSAGVNPVSVGLNGGILYVANKAIDPTATPSYVAMTIAANGALAPVASGGTINAPAGASPSQVYVSPDKAHLFSTDFFGPTLTPPEGAIRSFTITSTGTIAAGATDPVAIPADSAFPNAPPLALGLVAHPTESILYANFVTRGEVGVYTFDAAGALTYVGNTATMGPAPCWLVTDTAGAWLYAVNTGDASVSVLDLTTPMTPTLTQHFAMANTAGAAFTDASGKMQTVTSAAFQEALSPDGKTLYVVGQRVTTDVTDTTSPGNQLHVLTVAADGTVSEPTTPIPLALSVASRAQGVATFMP